MRALDNMMGGALEGKKEDVLKMVGHNIHTLFKKSNYYGSCLDLFFHSGIVTPQ